MIWNGKQGILFGQKVYVKGDTIPDSAFKDFPKGTKEGLIKSGNLIESPKPLEEKPKDDKPKVDFRKKKKVKKNV